MRGKAVGSGTLEAVDRAVMIFPVNGAHGLEG
jgi:hypothetical protein